MVIKQYLTFTLRAAQYAVIVAHVREVLSEMPLTVIPCMPEYLQGVINIRGNVVPVVDLRTKFGLESTESTIDTSIIVMDVHARDDEDVVTVGCLADSVQEVIEIPDENIEPPPTLGTAIDARFIKGLGKKDDDFIMVLDIDRVFREDEIEVLRVEADESVST